MKILIYRATREKSYLSHHNKGSETLHTVYKVEVNLRIWWRHVSWCVEQKICSEKCTEWFLEDKERVRHDFRRVGSHFWEWLVCLSWQDLYDGTINFEHVTLTVTFDLHLDNFNSPQNFPTIRHRNFIFGVCVPYIKTFLVVT